MVTSTTEWDYGYFRSASLREDRMSPRVSKWPALASIAFLLLAAVGGWRYGFYTLLRLVVCGSAIYLAVQANKLRKSAWVWVMGGTAVLFNPLVPVRVHRSDWQVLDFIGAVVFGTSLFTIREKQVSGRGMLRIGGVLRWLVSEGWGPAEDLQTAGPVEEAVKPVSVAPRPLISDMAEGDITDPRVREWIDEEYRRVTAVPIETEKPPVPARLLRSSSSTKTATAEPSTTREPNRVVASTMARTKFGKWLDGELDIGWLDKLCDLWGSLVIGALYAILVVQFLFMLPFLALQALGNCLWKWFTRHSKVL